MGKQIDKLQTQRRIERSKDPHGWAERLERNDAWRTMMVTILVIAACIMGWQVYTLRQDVLHIEKSMKAPPEDAPCVPAPGPSGQMPPSGFC